MRHAAAGVEGAHDVTESRNLAVYDLDALRLPLTVSIERIRLWSVNHVLIINFDDCDLFTLDIVTFKIQGDLLSQLAKWDVALLLALDAEAGLIAVLVEDSFDKDPATSSEAQDEVEC